MNLSITLGIFDLVGVIMLVLAGTSFIYLLRVKNKSSASRMLLWFFLCVVLSSIATILTNSGTTWGWAFAPSQDALLILGGVFLVRFAYSFPTRDQARESRYAALFFLILAFSSLTYSVSFALSYIANLPGDLSEHQAFYFITPIAILIMVIVFFRRSIHLSLQSLSSNESNVHAGGAYFTVLIKPLNRSAVALRSYGLSLAIGLIPVLVVVVKAILPAVAASFLFNFGAVMAIAALMLTYLNHASEPVTISAKLIGISLVSILLILGFAGVWIYHANPGLDVHKLVSQFILLVLLSSLLIILIFPLFFRTALLDPLEQLSGGVKQANEGNLDIQVPVQYDDEIGFLTESFNRMVSNLNEATLELQNQASVLERAVDERTTELFQKTEQLEKENVDRQNAESRLNQQLLYQQALAGCSQALLVTADNESNQQEVLNQALEYLRSVVQVSRAYIIRTFDDPEMGMCAGILAEVTAEGIFPHIDNPINQRVPLSRFPSDMVKDLVDGKPYGGPSRQVLASSQGTLEDFLNQKNPLLSFICFPVFDQERWWGFVGFDDCVTEREWDEMEISILRTASEMIGSTMQRWGTASQLRETLDYLELRVEERTSDLNMEIQERQRAQEDLANRLQTEEKLSIISTRLLNPRNTRDNISKSLYDLLGIMNAGRTFLVEFDLQAPYQAKDFIDQHTSDMQDVSQDDIHQIIKSLGGFENRLSNGETIFIKDTAQPSPIDEINLHTLQARNIHSMVLAPLIIDRRIYGVLGCSNPEISSNSGALNLRPLELVASMLKSLLQREHLIETLEEQVAERTRQLTTFLDMAMLREQTQDLADLLQPTLFSVTQIASCDAAAIHIIEEDQFSLELIAQRGLPLEFLESVREVEIDSGFTEWLAYTDPYEVLDDLDSSPDFLEPFCLPVFGEFFANRIGTGSKALGLLSCYRVEDHPFSPFQATLLNSLGELLGIIVENHRLRIEAGELAAVEERQRLAREIHDAVSQSVYSLSLFARSASDALADQDQVKLLANLQDIENTALDAMREMRLLLYQLREAGQEENIATALNARFEQVEHRLGIQSTFVIEPDIFLPVHFQHELQRIIVEALNNVVKHANASRVEVKISCSEENLTVSIWDDGVGFDSDVRFPGMGLKNMQARTGSLGGNLDITSKSGQGTRMRLKIPMACLEVGEGE